MVRGEILISAVSSGETSHGVCYDWQCEFIGMTLKSNLAYVLPKKFKQMLK